MSETSSSPIPAAEREFQKAESASRRPVHDSVVDRHLARAQHFALTGIAEMLAEICEHLRADLGLRSKPHPRAGGEDSPIVDPATLKAGDRISYRFLEGLTMTASLEKRTDGCLVAGDTIGAQHVIRRPDGTVPDVIRDLQLVEAAPEAAGWVDRHGDVWRDGSDGLMHSFETRPFPREHVERKWGPLRPVSKAQAPRDPQRLVSVRHDDLAALLSGWVDGASVSNETEDHVRAALRGETQ